MQKFLIKQKSWNYFELTFQFLRDYLSPMLREFIGYYSNRLTYKELEKTIKRVTGKRIISDREIWEVVTNKAVEISSELKDEINRINLSVTEAVKIATTVDIYNSKAEEVLLFDDGISVTEQKENRQSKKQKSVTIKDSWPRAKEISEPKKVRKKVITDVVMLETQAQKI